MSAGLRVDLYRKTTYTDGWHLDVVYPNGSEWRWRLWSSSSIIAASSEGYDRQARAIGNLENVLGGLFVKTSTPDRPTPYGELWRRRPITGPDDAGESIPVRLVGDV